MAQSVDPSKFKEMIEGDMIVVHNDYSHDNGGTYCTYKLASTKHAACLLKKAKHLGDNYGPPSTKRFGDKCPRCGNTLTNTERGTRNDSFWGYDEDQYVCRCGIVRDYKYSGY